MKPAALLFTILMVGAVYVLAGVFLRLHLGRGLSKAMARGDYGRYRRLVFSRITDLLIDRDNLCLLRASILAPEGEYRQAKTYLSLIKKERLDVPHLLEYYRAMFIVALGQKDLSGAEAIQRELEKLMKNNRSPELGEQFEDNRINIRLYLRFDPSVIEDIRLRMEYQTGRQRGASHMALAKALHLAGREDEARESLKEAKKLLSDTAYIPAIDAALQDPGRMD